MHNLYFKGKAEKFIFALLEADGTVRMKLLGIVREHYSNKNLAIRWKSAIESVIHPDICPHSKASEAMMALDKFYNRMTGG